MATTTVINKTTNPIKLKEGNLGMYTLIGELQPNTKKDITVDEHATYREYWVGTDNAGKIILTSDDCIDNRLIEVHCSGNEYTCKKTERIPKKSNMAGTPATANITSGLKGWFQRIANWISSKTT